MTYTITDNTEETLRRWWEVGRGAELVTRDGVRLRVVYRGRGNRGPGPDFRDVVLATETAQLWQGDLEVDRLSSGWWAHGHHRDPAYNSVVLQMVSHDDTSRTPHRPDGVAVAVACPGETPEAEDSLTDLDGCRRPLERTVGPVLDRLGAQRFEDKVARFEAALSQEPPAEVLYQGLMEALGYPHNRDAFSRLARGLPLAMVESFLWGKPQAVMASWAEALLLGAAGLLEEVSGLRRLWAGTALTRDEDIAWRWAGGRPLNHPARRLRGMARLLCRHQGPGLVAALAQAVEMGQPQVLEAALVVAQETPPALIGGERAREMVINVVLPFFGAGGGTSHQQKQAEDLFAGYPPTGSNAVLRQMLSQLGPGLKPWLNTARRQQGLLHLYRCFCTQGRCRQCPWTGSTSGDIIIRERKSWPFLLREDVGASGYEKGGSPWVKLVG